jgi:WD40 repeat protein
MRRTVLALSAFLILAPAFAAPPQLPAPGCTVPFFPKPHGENFFSEDQEVWLADILAEHIEQRFRIIEDEELVGPLRRIGHRLVQFLPPTRIPYRFYLLDMPATNAFASAGGRIYVTRRLISAARTEDELAGVLAHEIGHLVARDVPVRFTFLFKWALNVKQVGARDDIYEKYHLLLDTWMRNQGKVPPDPDHSPDAEQLRQIAADRFGAELAALAGYAPEAYAELWDRLMETKGNAGNWFTKFFGFAEPEQERLHAIRQMAQKLPEACRGPSAARPAEYEKWQAEVIAFNGTGLREELSGIIYRKNLQPPLRSDVSHFRFSPDGRFLLAQDLASIHVISVAEARVLFSIPADETYAAQFTPDSSAVVFSDRHLQVEWWSIPQQRRTFVQLLAPRWDCLQSKLSPDGRTLACINQLGDFRLLDVSTGNVLYEKKRMIMWGNRGQRIFLGSQDRDFTTLVSATYGEMAFSPDGRYLVTSADDDDAVYDLAAKKPLKMPRAARKVLRSFFTFQSPDRLVVRKDERKAQIVQFPSGERLDEFEVGGASLSAPTAGNFLLLRPIDHFPVGVFDIAARRVIRANRRPALDVYNNFIASERTDGEVGLYRLDSDGPVARVPLPMSNFPALRAATVSPDLEWLAVSNMRRGGVWNLSTAQRVTHVRGFRDAWLGDGPTLYADFPKFATQEHIIGRVAVGGEDASPVIALGSLRAMQRGSTVISLRPADPKKDAKEERERLKQLEKNRKERDKQRKKRGEAPGDEKYIYAEEEKVPEMRAGPLPCDFMPTVRSLEQSFEQLLRHLLAGPMRCNAILEVRDTRTGALLWSRHFKHEVPSSVAVPLEERIVFYWRLPSFEVSRMADSDPALRERLKSQHDKEQDYYVEVVEARTGKKLGGLLVETGRGSFWVRNVLSSGDWLVVSDWYDRLLLYSLSTGELKAKLFGRNPALNAAAQLLSVTNERGKLRLYRLNDAPGLPPLQHRFGFSELVAFAQFSRDGRRLFVLTANQQALLLDIATLTATSAQ